MATCRRFDCSLTGRDTTEFTFRLQNEKHFIPDVYKDYSRMMDEYTHVMNTCCQPYALVGPDNKMGGVFYVGDVVAGHEGIFYCWVWNPKCYTPTTARFIREYIEAAAEENDLARIVCRTPDDKKLGKLLESLRFKLEGRFRNGYKSRGQLMTLFQFRRLFRGGV